MNPPPWLRRYWIFIALAVLVAATIAPSLRSPPLADWLNTYVVAAQNMVARQPINDGGPLPEGVGRFTYMPAGAIYALPVAFLPPMAALVVWYVASLAAICAGFVLAWRLAGGPAFEKVDRQWLLIFGLTTLLVLRFVISGFGNRQTDLLIAGVVIAGCWFVATRRQWRGAALLGLGASIKGPPLLFAPYLVWRGQWRAAAIMVAVLLGVNLLPDMLWWRGGGQSYLVDWRHSLTPVRDAPPGMWFADILRNQSVAGVVGRFAAMGMVLPGEEIPEEFTPMTATQVRTARLLVYAIDLLLVAVTVFAFRRRERSRGDPPLRAAEFGAVICLMLLLSPMTAKAHMGVLILPVLLIAREVVQRRSTGWIVLAVLLALTGPLSAADLAGKAISNPALALGGPAMFTFLCLMGMWGMGGGARPENGTAQSQGR